MPSIRVPAFAKVNLRLDVLGRRADGYHELRTIFQSISLHDSLQLELSRKPGIELDIAGDPVLAAGSHRENLVWRAAEALCRDLKLSRGVRIILKKRVPVGRGLGGGSSSPPASGQTSPSLSSAGEPWEPAAAMKSTPCRTASGERLLSFRLAI
jgi:4-diphosphocytidyl-2-C-methyl-D-erythritol kinase